MTVLRANFGELLEPGLAHVFFNEFDRWEPEYKEISKVYNSRKQFEQDQLITGLSAMSSKDEGVGVTYEDISQGYTQTYTHTTYAKAIRITKEMYEDDLYGVMKDLTGALARSAYQRIEVETANILNNAFAGTAGSDGTSLINATHTLSVGGTQSNALAANADLSTASLQEAIQIIEDTQDERGLNVALRPSKLICTTANQWTGCELLKSQYKPGTADNEVNAIMGKALELKVNHYLTDADSWFLLVLASGRAQDSFLVEANA
jgi:phage major head subunit gpT-like protein